MKPLLTLLLLLLPCCLAAQDLIVKKDKSTIRCRIEEVTDSMVSYMQWDDKSGTCYLIEKSLVSSIHFENGKKEMYIKFDPADPYKKVRRLKIAGWVGGGILAGIGTSFLLRWAYYRNDFSKTYGIKYGIPCLAVGAGFTAAFHIAANMQKKTIDATLQTSSIYRQDISFRDGTSLSIGADLMNDCILNKQTVGIGLSYQF